MKQAKNNALFQNEQLVLDQADQVLEQDQHKENPLFAPLQVLSKAYKRLLRKTKHLTRLSDLNQNKLQVVSRQLDEVLGRQIGQEIKEEILRQDAFVEGIHHRNLTVMFVDIRGYATIAESLEAKQVIQLLKNYYEFVLDIVHRHNGLVKSFMGDGVMLIFGFRSPETASRDALLCALEIREKLPQFNQVLETNLRVGIGIHQGPTAVSEIGTRERSELAIIGNTVNIASRIQLETKYQNRPLLFSESVFRNLHDLPLAYEMVIETKLRGQKTQVKLYTVKGQVWH